MALGDVNDDGADDLLARAAGGDLHVYINQHGSGLNTFSRTPQIVGTGWGAYNEINLADVNADGYDDLFARASNGELHVYINQHGTGLNTFFGFFEIAGTGWGGYNDINLG